MSYEMDISLWHWEYYLTRQFPFIGKKKVETVYRGECTVWHDVKTGKRPCTSTEMQLSEIEWLRKQQESDQKAGAE